ncbi:MAG: methyltransferase domain-containing protein [Thermoleophilia bacterium]
MPPSPHREWDAETYHRISTPQRAWGARVLERLHLAGDEVVLDAGCGSGHLTEALLELVPRGSVVAADASAQMLDLARAHLAAYGARVRFIHTDLVELHVDEPVDAAFSNAVFHHIPDHPTLFGALHRCLRPGGRLVTQCGGGPNLARVREAGAGGGHGAQDRTALAGWAGPWNHSDAERGARELTTAGFIDVSTWVEPAPVRLADAAAFREHLRTVTLRSHLMRLSESARDAFLDDMVERSAAEEHPFTLDHWRLNMDATRL